MQKGKTMLVEFKNMGLEVAEHKKHEWTMPTRDVARGYEVSESVLRDHKRKHADELIEGKHFLCVSNIDAQNKTCRRARRGKTLLCPEGQIVRLGKRIKPRIEYYCLDKKRSNPLRILDQERESKHA